MDINGSRKTFQIKGCLITHQSTGDQTVLALVMLWGECTIGGGEEKVGVAFEGVDVVLLGYFIAHYAGKHCQKGQEEVEEDGML